MSYHVVYNHQCPQCGAHYIPFDQDVPCPRCGHVEAERFDYIREAVASMRTHKKMWGVYTPGAWWVGSLGDHFLHLLFGVFDYYEERRPEPSFEEYVSGWVRRSEWGEHPYHRDHFLSIALRVQEELAAAPPEEAETRLPAPVDPVKEARERERRRAEQRERAKTPWGEALCTRCGARKGTWADSARGVCARCGEPLGPEPVAATEPR